MKDIKILRTNSIYRVTDIIFRKGIRWEQDRKSILTEPLYKNTILYDYLSQMNHEEDLETFKRVVIHHQQKYELPSPNTLVVHLRLGDIMDDDINVDVRRHYRNNKETYSG